ncbi:hypothetical protein BN946_scf184908.g71 [Trametes cinnabarina]|uniref:BCD1 alpha/beta domain-containing protein n=1 Tax=Pycnoporus cinnabarinus TaxID=5643 RepID=A0A060SGH9_PYCCI|nr:hypothetical protein BN946_scf184908.g71 [Trametes cinnabarina]
MRTCSLPCSNKHKTLGEGCSGIRNKAAYVPMNQYGYMTLMSDYTFLEDMGRKVGDWGREIVQGGYLASAAGASRGGRDARGRGRGRGRGGAHGKPASKRDVLKMQLDFRDIEVELLPNGMERRTLNQSTWDFKYAPCSVFLDFKFHPPRSALAPASQPPEPPFSLLTHRNTLETTLFAAMRAHVSERSKSKKDKAPPTWVQELVLPDQDVPDSFAPPLCVMSTPLDPLASLNGQNHIPQPGRLLRFGYYRLDPNLPIGTVLKHKHFVEFPTIQVWEEGAFQGTIVDDRGAVVHNDADLPQPKRRKLDAKQAKKAMSGLLGGYGSDEEDAGEEEHNVMNLLEGYAGSDEEGGGEVAEATAGVDEEWGTEDAEGVTDDEMEGDPVADPEALAAMLQKLREAGALRDPGAGSAFSGLGGMEEEQVDWGESDAEEDGS